MNEHWICGRCLAVVNANTSIYATHKSGQEVVEDFPWSPIDLIRLRSWAEDKVASGDWIIGVNQYTRAFAPVATWHGDPVCEGHLRECRQRELMSVKGAWTV